MRLQVFLSHNGVASRRKAMEIIQAGRVAVNEEIIEEPSFNVEARDIIFVDGKRVGKKGYQYVMLNKPKDYHTTKLDVHADKTVYDLLPKQYKHLAPVGRLDRDTEGLLLFTNDGDTLYRLTHPKFDLDKVYFVTVKGYLEDVIKQKVERGVHLGPERTSPAKIQILKRKKESSEFLLTIHEGKKRQIRRMMAKLRLPVSYLKRTSHGPIKLGKLAPGYYRELTSIEIDQIRNLE